MALSNVGLWQNAINNLVRVIERFGQPMELQTRSAQAPRNGSTDLTLNFTKKFDFIGAIDTGNKGKTIFDGSSTEQVVSQIIYLEYRDDVTAEDWILYNNRRLDILDVENIGELNGILKLTCNERGTDANEANKA